MLDGCQEAENEALLATQVSLEERRRNIEYSRKQLPVLELDGWRSGTDRRNDRCR